MFNTIVVATDNSDHARKAIHMASELAEKHSAELVIVHVINPRHHSPELRHMAEVEHLIRTDTHNKGLSSTLGLPGDWAARMSSLRDSNTDNLTIMTAVGEYLLKSAKDQVSRKIPKVTTRLEDGDPVDGILRVIREHNADLVVLGTRGLGEIKGLLMGSVSHKIGQLAPCACLTVK